MNRESAAQFVLKSNRKEEVAGGMPGLIDRLMEGQLMLPLRRHDDLFRFKKELCLKHSAWQFDITQVDEYTAGNLPPTDQKEKNKFWSYWRQTNMKPQIHSFIISQTRAAEFPLTSIRKFSVNCMFCWNRGFTGAICSIERI